MYIFTPNPQNYYMYNPINPNDQLWWGYGYPVEIFYKIDFLNIRKDTYLISNYGRIFSLNTKSQMHNANQKSGYIRLNLTMEQGYGDNYNRKSFNLHYLVATAFIIKTEDDILKGRDIPNHKNLITSDNHVWNLEWVTEQENTIHALQNNASLYKNMPSLFQPISEQPQENNWGKGIAKGDRNGKTRVSDQQVHILCQGLEQGKSPKECCLMAGLEWNEANSALLNNIKSGRRRQDIVSQYNINTSSRPQFDYSFIEPKVYELLIQGFGTKQIYEMIKSEIPYFEGETDKKHYDRVRIKIGSMKKKFKL